jgi:hypothetical protein
MEDINLRKLRIIEFLLQEHDADAIRRIEELIVRIGYDEDSKTKIIGFQPNGVAVFKSDFLDAIATSLKEVEQGITTSLERVEKDSENW